MKTADAEIGCEVDQEYIGVIEMDPLIETYHEVCANDLEGRIGVNNDRLPTTLGVVTLLKPLFGLLKKLLGLDRLMTGEQYDQDRVEVICQMEDIMDEKSPPVYSSVTAKAVRLIVMMRNCLANRT